MDRDHADITLALALPFDYKRGHTHTCARQSMSTRFPRVGRPASSLRSPARNTKTKTRSFDITALSLLCVLAWTTCMITSFLLRTCRHNHRNFHLRHPSCTHAHIQLSRHPHFTPLVGMDNPLRPSHTRTPSALTLLDPQGYISELDHIESDFPCGCWGVHVRWPTSPRQHSTCIDPTQSTMRVRSNSRRWTTATSLRPQRLPHPSKRSKRRFVVGGQPTRRHNAAIAAKTLAMLTYAPFPT